MELKFSVSGRINRPVRDVFEAVVDPAELSHYFTTGGAKGRLEAGATVIWDFADFPGAFPVTVIEVEPDSKIVLRWAATDGSAHEVTGKQPKTVAYETTVTMEFRALDDGRTLVTISEEGWHETEGGLKACLGNCQGWSQMLCAMKAWVEHRINLREGFYK